MMPSNICTKFVKDLEQRSPAEEMKSKFEKSVEEISLKIRGIFRMSSSRSR